VSTSGAIIEARGISKTYGLGRTEVVALAEFDLRVAYGETVALLGPSGSGKSTLLNVLGCLDRPSRGTYELGGSDVSELDRTAQAWVRLHYIGFVFQTFHLIGRATALENVMVPLRYAGMAPRDREARAKELLARVGLAARANHRPAELSGGERQRVAIARALAGRPRLLLADEPTGALDSRSGVEILRLLAELRESEGLTIVLVTHDPSVGKFADREVHLRDGRLVSVVENAHAARA
jgi:putative ABC transport system ATP-binding protein